MLQVFSLLTVMVVAAVTPGPNNFIILSLGSSSGALATVRPILGVLLGSVAMFLAVWFAADFFLANLPRFRFAIGLIGCVYLVWLGLKLIRSAGHGGQSQGSSLPRGVLPLAFLQVVNPKTWMFTVAVVGAGVAREDDLLDLPLLLVAIMMVMGGCMALWAGAGAALASHLEKEGVRTWFDRLMGAALVVSAPLILV